jgi:hypothetical protein
MVTTRLNGTFNGTLHHKGESPEYYVEQSVRRPRRQRILAIFLVALTPLFVAYAIVDLPRANVRATVVGTGPAIPGSDGSPAVTVSYVWQGVPTTTAIQLDSTIDTTKKYPVGSTVWVHASVANDVYDTASAELPVDQMVGGIFLTVVALLSAAFLWRSARRNERRGPLTMPVYLDPR